MPTALAEPRSANPFNLAASARRRRSRPLTQRELSSLIASSRESIVRSLRSLRARRLVTTRRRRITIRSLDRLRLLADGGYPTQMLLGEVSDHRETVSRERRS